MSGRAAGGLYWVILAFAAWVRFHDLGTWSLDGDELYSYYDVLRILDGDVWPFGARTYPVGYLLMTGCAQLLGMSEFALRLPSALCGVAAVGVLLFLRRREVPPAVTLTAGALAAVSPWLVYHAQTARFYGPLILFATLSTAWALPGPGRRPWLAFGAWLLAVMCHPLAVLMGPALLVPLFADRRGRRRALGLVAIVVSVVGLVLFLDDGSMLEVFKRGADAVDPGTYDLTHLLLGLGYNLGPYTGLLALGGLLTLSGAIGSRRGVLATAALLPPLLLALATLCGAAVYQRYAMMAVPATLLLAGHGMEALLRARPRLGLLAAVMLVLPSLPGLVAHAADGNRHDARAVARWLALHTDPQDIFGLEEHATIGLYLHEEPGFSDISSRETPLTPDQRRSFLGNRRDSWLALKATRWDENPDFAAWVSSYYDLVATVGREPLRLVRHDNRYEIFHRRERVLANPRRAANSQRERAPAETRRDR